MIDASDVRRARRNAGGDHYLIKTAAVELLCGDALIQVQSNAEQFDLTAVIAQCFAELFFARNLFGNIKLPANFTGAVEQTHLMTPCCQCCCRRQTGRSGTDNSDSFLGSCWNNVELCFMAGAGIDETACHDTAENMVQTGLITANAGINFISAIFLRF